MTSFEKVQGKQIRFVIVEDQRIDELSLLALTQQQQDWLHLATASDIAEGLTYIKNLQPDLVFMDIDIPGGSGVELAKVLAGQIPMLVFSTSHDEYVLDAFQLAALDYLLKPISNLRFAQTALRISEYWQMRQSADAYKLVIEGAAIFVKDGYNKHKVSLKEILYLEAMQDYTKIVTNGQKYMVNMPLSTFLQQYSNFQFLRIHRSYAVLQSHIVRVSTSEIIVSDAIRLPVGKTYRMAISQYLNTGI